jgi:hypothetical protein
MKKTKIRFVLLESNLRYVNDINALDGGLHPFEKI